MTPDPEVAGIVRAPILVRPLIRAVSGRWLLLMALAFACHACASPALATLAGSVWVLRAWDVTDPAGSEPVVTLVYDAGRFEGTGGCNRYFAGVKPGDTPGEISVGPLAGTRMACPEPQSSVEARFLEQLGGARTFGFMQGRLAISYTRVDGTRGTMLFDARTPSKEP